MGGENFAGIEGMFDDVWGDTCAVPAMRFTVALRTPGLVRRALVRAAEHAPHVIPHTRSWRESLSPRPSTRASNPVSSIAVTSCSCSNRAHSLWESFESNCRCRCLPTEIFPAHKLLTLSLHICLSCSTTTSITSSSFSGAVAVRLLCSATVGY